MSPSGKALVFGTSIAKVRILSSQCLLVFYILFYTKNLISFIIVNRLVGVTQLVRVLDCDSKSHGFKSRHLPKLLKNYLKYN